MDKAKIALAMIVRGEDERDIRNLTRALDSAQPHVDGVFVTITGDSTKTKAIDALLKARGVHVSYEQATYTVEQTTVDWLKAFFGYEPHMKAGDKLFMFDAARNYSFAQVPKDYTWIMWMDSDDVLRRGEKIPQVLEIGRQAEIDAFYLNYIYQADTDKVDGKYVVKTSIIEHLRERIVRNAGLYKWVAPIHETLIEQKPTRKTDNYDVDILHLATHEDRLSSLSRNLNNLELAIYRSEGKDPRQIYYLAKAFYDLNTPEYTEKAIPLIMKYLVGEHPSGWAEERQQAWEYLAELYRRKSDHDRSIKALMNAQMEAVPTPNLFLQLAISYMVKGQWEWALFWVKLAAQTADRKSTLVKNPFDLQARTLEVIYNCSLNLGMVDEAWAAATKLVELMPDDPQMQQAMQFITLLRTQRDVTKSVVELSELLKQTGEVAKIRPLLAAVPQLAENNPFIENLRQQNLPPTYHSEKAVAIYCGPGFTTWSPKKMETPGQSFVGGSEEAVIEMSRALSEQGWEVTVYADPGEDEGVHGKVAYLPYYKFNKSDEFNVLIYWRQPNMLDQDIKAKKTYVWCHDIQNPLDWTPERLQRLTKAMFLSKWHRDNVPSLPEEKVWLTSNGL